MFFTKYKWAVSNFEQEKWMIKKFREKNIKTPRNSHSQLHYWLFVLLIYEKSPQKVSSPDTCGVKKHRSHHAVSLL